MNLRFLIVALSLVVMHNGVWPAAHGQTDPSAASDGTPPASAPPSSTVVVVERPSAVTNFAPVPGALNEMFSAGLRRLTGQPDAASAWKSLGIQPNDVVGIKITTSGGSLLSTHRELISTIVSGLVASGVPGNQIVIWDKFADDMRLADWTPTPAGSKTPAVVSVVPGASFDPRVFYVNEILGRLIWGDLQFVGTRPTGADLMAAARRAAQEANPVYGDDVSAPAAPPSADQTSNKSFYTTILTQQCSKIINVPILSDSTATGLGGCLSTLAMGSVDNTRRFSGDPAWGDPAVPEILDKDFIRQKVVLHVLDAMVAQFAGGPRFNPVFTQSIGALYLSKDPVAIDTIVLARMEQWRSDNNVDPLGKTASHVTTAATYNLGQSDRKKINLIKVP